MRSSKTIYTITVTTKKPLTDEQALELMESMKWRLEGYESKSPSLTNQIWN